jgi:hypothetical protein
MSEPMEESIELYTEIVESTFKAVIWSSITAIFSAALVYHKNELWVLIPSLIFALVLVFMIYTWSLFKIAVPTCKLFFPNAGYYKALEALYRIKDKKNRNKAYFKAFFWPENLLFFLLYFALFLSLGYVYEIFLISYVAKL